MEGLFHDRYRIQTARLPGWDYSSSGYYFVTICTHNRVCHFGDVLRDNNGEYSVVLTEIGKIVRDCWLAIPVHFPHVRLDEWVIMPNHVHGIIFMQNARGDYDAHGSFHGRDVACNVSTGPRPGRIDLKHASSDERKQWMAHISPAPSALPAIIRSFKSAVTKQCDERALHAVRHYIQTNPDRWHRDRNNIENIWY